MAVQVGGAVALVVNQQPTDLLNSASVIDGGTYRVTLYTTDSQVYIGGTRMPAGSTIVAGNNSAAGFLMAPNVTYTLDVYWEQTEPQLFATTPDTNAEFVNVLAVLLEP